ncbi:MAG: DUF853 family protein [Alphaproteobacteria bacterium]|nr:DUF853 family protein [Alphaproteobacteria bacterium]
MPGVLLGQVGLSPVGLLARMANRHGLIAGATGTGKTATMLTLAEGFSRLGVPVLLADVKGDVAGLSQAGGQNPRVTERVAKLGLKDWRAEASPVVFWDVLGQAGHPLRTTVSEIGPMLFARLLGLNEVQAGVLTVAFTLADDEGLLLVDLKDLRAVLAHVADHAKAIGTRYGGVSGASVGAIQRALLELERQGGEKFLGEPAFDPLELLTPGPGGRGPIHVLAADKLLAAPRVYACFLLWLLAELFERLPEVGDADKPGLVLFFDEAHLLFDEAPKALVDSVERVTRLIRSKGVGVYFVTQSPLDLPEMVLGQLGNRVQHALRAFTPKDQQAVRAAADTFRPNPRIDTARAITELAVGEALVSTLGADGSPGVVERALIAPPRCRLGAISPEERRQTMQAGPFAGRYDTPVDRESAFELLANRVDRGAAPAPSPWGRPEAPPPDDAGAKSAADIWGRRPAPSAPPRESAPPRSSAPASPRPTRPPPDYRPAPDYGAERAPPRGTSRREGLAEAMMKSAGRAIASEVGRRVIRGVLGSILK